MRYVTVEIEGKSKRLPQYLAEQGATLADQHARFEKGITRTHPDYKKVCDKYFSGFARGLLESMQGRKGG